MPNTIGLLASTVGYLQERLSQPSQKEEEFTTPAEHLIVHARKAKYAFDWDKMQKSLEKYQDPRLLLQFAEEDKQHLPMNYVELLEGVNFYHGEPELLEFYIKRAKLASQVIDWSMLVDLLHNYPEGLAAVKKHIPSDCKMRVFEEGFDIDILANEHLLSDLGRYSMATTDFTEVTYEGKKYAVETDECEECEMHAGDISDCNAPAEIFPNNPSDVEYHLKYDAYLTFFNSDEFDTSNHDLIRRIQHADLPEKVKLMSPGAKMLILHNTSGVNEDHRGYHHCKVDLEYHASFKLPLPCTLLDFMKAIYQIKSHKRDHWYELYGGMKLKSFKKGIITVDCCFDHGS